MQGFGSSVPVEKLCNERALHNHRALGAEFLTAEAANALFPVDFGQFILNLNRMGRTDSRTQNHQGHV